jgi:hypothetical protein
MSGSDVAQTRSGQQAQAKATQFDLALVRAADDGHEDVEASVARFNSAW